MHRTSSGARPCAPWVQEQWRGLSPGASSMCSNANASAAEHTKPAPKPAATSLIASRSSKTHSANTLGTACCHRSPSHSSRNGSRRAHRKPGAVQPQDNGRFMALCHLRHRRPTNPDRYDNLQLVLVTPEAPPLHPKNFTTHLRPSRRHVVIPDGSVRFGQLRRNAQRRCRAREGSALCAPSQP